LQYSQINQGLTGPSRDILATYWQQTINHLETDNHDFKIHQLPLARIKKVMKADPEVKMISAEAPILFAKGCDIFITELTMRAWIHAEDNKRRTLQRSDIAAALAKSDMFDFLIDIVPREESGGSASGQARRPATSGGTTAQQQQQPQPPPQQQHATMGPPDYAQMHAAQSHGGMEQSGYGQPGQMYGHMRTGDGTQDPNAAYGQPAMFGGGGGEMYNPYAQQQYGGGMGGVPGGVNHMHGSHQ
jgi:nuclear transcription factor Y, gamma